jgi:hypothetical protein
MSLEHNQRGHAVFNYPDSLKNSQDADIDFASTWAESAIKLGVLADSLGVYQQVGSEYSQIQVRDFPALMSRNTHSIDMGIDNRLGQAITDVSGLDLEEWIMRVFSFKQRVASGNLQLYVLGSDGTPVRLNREFVNDHFKEFKEEMRILTAKEHPSTA